MKNYSDVVVPKPWGREYVLFDTSDVAGWILHINKDKATSLHCHPKKKTSLIVLSGTVKISFLTSSHIYKGGDKVIIREGVFHSTEALEDSILLEIETPVDKTDLIRLRDSYGRQSKPYETEYQPRSNEEPYLVLGKINSTKLCDDTVLLTFKKVKEVINTEENKKDIFVFLNGGIFSLENIRVSGMGDSLTMKSFKILSKEFELLENSDILHIQFS